jgi:hypothetical protein
LGVHRGELSTLHKTRRILYRTEPEVTVTLIGMLLSHVKGQDAVRELLRVPQMRQHLASCAGRLSELGITLDGRCRSEISTAPAPSSYVVAHYDRERLYEEVWSEPTREVARRYGISDVALSKACKQLQIPKPPRGYWAKKHNGRPVPRRPRLPTLPRLSR